MIRYQRCLKFLSHLRLRHPVYTHKVQTNDIALHTLIGKYESGNVKVCLIDKQCGFDIILYQVSHIDM